MTSPLQNPLSGLVVRQLHALCSGPTPSRTALNVRSRMEGGSACNLFITYSPRSLAQSLRPFLWTCLPCTPYALLNGGSRRPPPPALVRRSGRYSSASEGALPVNAPFSGSLSLLETYAGPLPRVGHDQHLPAAITRRHPMVCRCQMDRLDTRRHPLWEHAFDSGPSCSLASVLDLLATRRSFSRGFLVVRRSWAWPNAYGVLKREQGNSPALEWGLHLFVHLSTSASPSPSASSPSCLCQPLSLWPVSVRSGSSRLLSLFDAWQVPHQNSIRGLHVVRRRRYRFLDRLVLKREQGCPFGLGTIH